MPVNSTESGSALLLKKRALLEEILKITESAEFSENPGQNTDAETEAFIELYDRRESVVAELMQTQKLMAGLGPLTQEDRAVSDRCDELLARIIKLDKRNQGIGKEMFKNVRANIKRINQGRAASLKYANPSATDGHMLDNKN
jgi:hypothetical protein